MSHRKGPQRKERRKYVRPAREVHDIGTLEKRKYIRLSYRDDFDFTVCSRDVIKAQAASHNVSQSGISFLSKTAPPKNAIVSMTIIPSLINKYVELKKIVQEQSGDVLGKVVRVSKSSTSDQFDVAIAFLKRGI